MIHGSVWCKVSLIVQQKTPIFTTLDMVYFTAFLSQAPEAIQRKEADSRKGHFILQKQASKDTKI